MSNSSISYPSICSSRLPSILHVVDAESLSQFQPDPHGWANSIEDDMLIVQLAKRPVWCVQYGTFFYLPGNFNNIHERSRLPVRTMLFQCPICNHGGHQACYRDYYIQYPMFDLPTTLPSPRNVRGRQLPKRPPPSVVEDDSASTISHSSAVEAPVMQNLEEPSRTAKLRGHPCAAGCGHFCWAVSSFDF